VDLARALEVAGAPARLQARADAEDLLKQVDGSGVVPAGWSLSLASAPEGIIVRPAEALHLLSLVTSHHYAGDDLYDAYACWGLLRYLGFFDHDVSDPESHALRVSRSGRGVKGVQRRVASEELGIAFGVLIASLRFREQVGLGVPVGIVDVDLLLHNSGRASSRRPDYVLVAGPGEGRPQEERRYLECKGTSDPKDSLEQMVKAVGQVAGPMLGSSASGIAVSTVTGATQLSFVALELTMAEAGQSAERGRERRNQKPHDPPQVAAANEKVDFIEAALETSWSMLGCYAGNQVAARRWSRTRASMADAVRGTEERRVRLDSASGPVVGVTTTFDLGDRQLIVTWALDSEPFSTCRSGCLLKL
jgi:hypothetical protein